MRVPRLIKQFQPIDYKLKIDLTSSSTYQGEVEIVGKVKTIKHKITLHSKDLTIINVLVDGLKASFYATSNDGLSIESSLLKQGKHTVKIEFSGRINDTMHGMYHCYFESDGKRQSIIATQFESHHAREVFPCADEPEAKATFDLTLVTRPGLVVLGNMPSKSVTKSKNQTVTEFMTTPKMSTYLLAWVVGRLNKKTGKTKSGVKVSVYASPAQPISSLDYALEFATKAIDFYDKYFKTPYPLPKCDHVALPDFSSGAMENWGLITYRESAMLVDAANPSVVDKRHVASVIAHELSHQWFGNLVTMKWWNDLWLNESFASYIEYLATDAIHPEWNIWLDFYSFEVPYALQNDSNDGIQPVRVKISHPDEISTLFDAAIVYAKGARLIDMLKNLIGDDNFRDGLSEYFKKFAYSNSEADDLWEVLGRVSKTEVKKFMKPWIEQPGYPVLSVKSLGKKVELSQKRIAKLGTKSDRQLWPIPLNSNQKIDPPVLKLKKTIVDYDNYNILRFNVGDSSHYITNYDQTLLKKITEKIEEYSNPIDRLQILSEQTILASCGLTDSASLIKLLDSYKNESHESVWGTMAIAIGDLKKFVTTKDGSSTNLKKLVLKLSIKQYERLGWKIGQNDSDEDRRLRMIVLGLIIFSEYSASIDEAEKIYKLKKLTDIDSDIRPHVLSAVVKFRPSKKIIDNLIRAYKSSQSSDLRSDICTALCSSKDNETIEQLLNLIKDSEIVRSQDVIQWIAHLMRNRHSKSMAFRWVRHNWDWITETFGGDKSYSDFPKIIARFIRSNKGLAVYKAFFLPLRQDPSLKRTITTGINEINGRLRLIKRDKQAVREVLNNL